MANSATAIYFDGSGDFLTFPSSPDLNFTTYESWVFEAWICLDSGGGANPVIYNAFGTDDNANSAGDHYLYFNTSNLKLYWGGVGIPSGSEWDSGALMKPVGTWAHFAFQYTNKTAAIYINGVLDKFAGSATSTITATSGDFKIGDDANINYFKGWMDAIRVSKVARYGTIDILTTRPKTWQTAGRGQNALLPHHTKVLITAENVADSGTNIIDRSSYGQNITIDSVTGSTTASIIGQAPHTPTSVFYSDGTNNASLRMRGGTLADLGGDWSAEGWFYSTEASGVECLMSGRDYAWGIRSASRNGTDYLGLTVGAGSSSSPGWSSPDPYIALGEPLRTNRWTHIACGYAAGSYFIFMNGKLGAAKTSANQYVLASNESNQQFNVGQWDTVPSWQFTGYFDNIRFCQGQSAYTLNFIPYGGQKNVAYNRGGVVTDARHPSANTHAIRMGQSAMGSTLATNANTYCLDFDGSADYLHRNVVSDWRSSDSQGTIFAWVYIDSAGVNTIFSSGGGNVITNGDFSNGVDGWTGAGYETLSNEGSGQSGNCLGITRVADSYQYVHQSFPTVSGVAYTFSAYVKTGSGDNVGYNIYVGADTPGNSGLSGSNAGTASGSWVQVTDTFTATGSVSVINLVRGASTAAGRMDFDTVRCYPTDERRFQVLVDASSKLGIHQENNDTVDDLYTAGSVATAGWHSVAIVSSGTAYTAYIDGVASSLSATTGTSSGDWLSDTINRNNLFIGTHNDKNTSGAPANLFNGKIMQVAYWGGASGTTGVLDADAIAALHAAGKGYDIKGSGNTGNYDSWAADLKGYWRMGNHYLDTPITIYDASGNGYDMHQVSNPSALTWSTGTTFLTNWQDRGFFSGDKYTSLLIQSSSANGSTTFTDSGPGFKKITFDGTDDRAHKTSLTNYRSSDTVGSIVAWIKVAAAKDNNAIFCYGDTAAGSNYFYWSINSDGRLTFQPVVSASSLGGQIYAGVSSVPVGKWSMVALTYDDTSYKMYVDGSEVSYTNALTGSGTATETWFNDLGSGVFDAICIGALLRNTDVHEFNGHIAGVGVWSSTLTATQLTAMHDLGPGGNWKTSYSSGLVDYWTFGNQIGEGTDTSSTIYSQVASGNDLTTSGSMTAPYAGHTITASGGPYHSTVTSAFGGSSIYFDGTDGKLTVPASADWAYGTRDFTIDLWMFSTDTTSYGGLFCNADGTGNTTEYLRLSHMSTAYIEFRMRNTTQGSNDNEINVSSIAGGVKQSTWHHIAAQRRNGQIELYVDGMPEGVPVASTHNHTWGNSEGIELGVRRESQWFQGYMDEIRFTTGITRYSPSIERYANTFVEKGDTGDAFTLMQIQSNGAKNGTAFSNELNETTGDHSIHSVNGNVPIWINPVGDSFGGANTALWWDDASWVRYTYNSALHEIHGLSGYTLEAWVWISPQDDDYNPIMTCGTDAWTTFWAFVINAGQVRFEYVRSGTRENVGNLSEAHVSNETWHHVAVSGINGGAFTFFIDGTNAGNGTLTTGGTVGEGDGVKFGAWQTTHFFKGYMDQFRFSSIARYGGASLRTTQQVVTSSNSDSQVVTSNSTFGTGDNAFTADAYTALLLQGDGTGFSGTAGDTFTDESASPGLGAKTVTNGTSAVTLRQGISAFGANSYYFTGSSGSKLSIPSSSDFAMGTGTFTVETWVKFNAVSANQFLMGTTSGTDNDFDLYMDCVGSDQGLVMYLNDTSYRSAGNIPPTALTWIHIAVQRDSSNVLSMFMNGELIGSHANATANILADPIALGQQWNDGDRFAGYMDSFHISKGIARYGYTGTNIKAGLNAVHHSHCKLLITSNTYNGNTHFDDFSDQGNYWNQTPYNYTFDGTNDYVDVGSSAPVSDYPFTFAFWVHPVALTGAYAGGMFDEGSADKGYGTRLSADGSAVTRSRNGTDSTATSATNSLHLGGWHCVVSVFTSDTSRAIYVDGQIAATDTGNIDFNTAVDNLIWGAEKDNAVGSLFNGRMAQAAMWDVSLTQANAQSMWELGPTGNWLTSFSSNILVYHAMGNHNEIGGRPADTAATVYDRSGNGRDGVTNGTMYAPHKGHLVVGSGSTHHSINQKNFGSSAIYFDGASPADFLGGKSYSLRHLHKGIQNNGTVEGWFFFESFAVTNGWGVRLVDCRNAANSAGWELTVGTDGSVGLRNTNSVTATPAGVCRLHTWHFISGVFDGTASKHIYVDGKLVGSGVSGTGTDGTGSLGIGAVGHTANAGLFKGFADEIALYSIVKYNSVAFPGQATITPSYLSDPSGNHFTTTGLTVTDQMLDTPENNFCTMNPLGADDGTNSYGVTYAEGNLKISSANDFALGTFALSTGKWYYEVKCLDDSAAAMSGSGVGWTSADGNSIQDGVHYDPGYFTGGFGYYKSGQKYSNTGPGQGGGYVTYGDTHQHGDILGVAVDIDAGKIWFARNDVWQASGDPITGANPAYSTVTSPITPKIGTHSASEQVYANFGAGDPDGENNFTDSEGRGGFRFEPPQDFLSLCTANMKDADYAPIGPNSAAGAPDKHFDTLLYTDTYAAGKPNRVGGLNFKPDLVWIKARSGSESNSLVDSVRGAGRRLMADNTGVEGAVGTGPMEFTEDGFVGGEGYGSDGDGSGKNFVAWCWKAGNGTVEDGSGTISVTRSTNVDAGFSIISYEKNATAGATIAHGLGKRPEFWVIKDRTAGNNWMCGHISVPATHYISLDQSIVSTDSNTRWNDTEPDANVITLGSGGHVNGPDGPHYICYAWTSIEGFSKFGSYEGNSNADGPFVYLGFRPAWVMIKSIDGTHNWWILDNKRNPSNPTNKYLLADTTSSVGEGTPYTALDFLSNGFKVRNTSNAFNSATHIYMAFAEMPFKYANAR